MKQDKFSFVDRVMWIRKITDIRERRHRMDRIVLCDSLDKQNPFMKRIKRFLRDVFLIDFDRISEDLSGSSADAVIMDDIYADVEAAASGYSLERLIDTIYPTYAHESFRYNHETVKECAGQIKWYCFLSALYTLTAIQKKDDYITLSKLCNKYGDKKYMYEGMEDSFSYQEYAETNDKAMDRLRYIYDALKPHSYTYLTERVSEKLEKASDNRHFGFYDKESAKEKAEKIEILKSEMLEPYDRVREKVMLKKWLEEIRQEVAEIQGVPILFSWKDVYLDILDLRLNKELKPETTKGNPNTRNINLFLDQFSFDVFISQMDFGFHLDKKINTLKYCEDVYKQHEKIREILRNISMFDQNFKFRKGEEDSETDELLYYWKRENVFHCNAWVYLLKNKHLAKVAKSFLSLPALVSYSSFKQLLTDAMPYCGLDNIEFIIDYLVNVTVPVYVYSFFIALCEYYDYNLENIKFNIEQYLKTHSIEIEKCEINLNTMEDTISSGDVIDDIGEGVLYLYDAEYCSCPFDDSFRYYTNNPVIGLAQCEIGFAYYEVIVR